MLQKSAARSSAFGSRVNAAPLRLGARSKASSVAVCAQIQVRGELPAGLPPALGFPNCDVKIERVVALRMQSIYGAQNYEDT